MDGGKNKDDANDLDAQCFKEMINEFNTESSRLNKQAKILAEKEEQEFIEALHRNGIAVHNNKKLTILDKHTNKIIDISGNKGGKIY